MNRNILNSVLLILVMGLVACAPKKIVVTPPPPAPAAPATEAVVQPPAGTGGKMDSVNMLKNKNVSYSTLSMTGKAKLNIDGKENNVNISLRIKAGEVIWASVSAAIVGEVARVLITPDSIKILNNLQSTYTKKPFSFVHEFTSKKIDFSVLQDVFSGNMISKLVGTEVTAQQQGGSWVLSGTTEELVYKFLFNTLQRVQETNLNDTRAAQALKVVYGDYQQLNGSLYPSRFDITSQSGNKNISIILDVAAIRGNVPLEYPFTVKTRFKTIN